ncbi:glycosyltransferase family 25 protein [Roseobacter sp. EG26]|uniref:glycosyltransferase family 25 protein n=1 Tax=Roseobacter sp. EG26 TaxID=3412477 RepID=UPI003CE45DAF
MTNPIEESVLPKVDKLYVINLESRPDRRREMLSELSRIGLDAQSPLVTFFAAVKPDAAGTFPSIGARGCFLSHLGVLRQARDAGHQIILILEDDAAITPDCLTQVASVMNELVTTEWSLAYLGHRIDAARMPGPDLARTGHWRELPSDVGIETTHAMLIHQQALTPLIDYFERMMSRPAGHPDGGPMHVDGAYSWFRRDHPERLTVITPRQYVVQRASRSDIASPSWKDSLPFLGLLRRLKNRISR